MTKECQMSVAVAASKGHWYCSSGLRPAASVYGSALVIRAWAFLRAWAFVIRHYAVRACEISFAKHQKTTEHYSSHNHMPLEIQIQKSVDPQHAGAVTVKLSGSLDTATAPELERQLAPLLAGPVKDLVYDLAQLKFISSAGLRVFSMARKQLKERGGQASFVNMQPQIQEVFEIIKALPGVAIFKNLAELDRYLAARQRSHQENQ